MSSGDLDALLAELPSLGIGELLELAAVHGSIEAEALESARSALRTSAARVHRADEVDRLRQDIARWATGAGESGRWLGETSGGDLRLADVRRTAVPAIVDAATVLLLGRAVDDETRDLLLGPWQRLREGPPESRDDPA